MKYSKHILKFKTPSGTSRGVLTEKETWFLISNRDDGNLAIGECGLLKTLSPDPVDNYEEILKWVCKNHNLPKENLNEKLTKYPSIQFGLEQLELSKNSEHPMVLFPSEFTKGKVGILTNGLVWMGSFKFIINQIEDKINLGFKCIKLKIGAINFNEELEIIRRIRSKFSKGIIEIRVDANGAFTLTEAIENLKYLSELDVHSIEQPIRQGQWRNMAKLCELSPVSIALDEELIGIHDDADKKRLLETIRPQYIILKPSLLGGYKHSKSWINHAERLGINWWVTSALESNIGLNAIAQWTHAMNVKNPQGLGTGRLFTNNIQSPLTLKNDYLWYDDSKTWQINF